MAAGVAARLGWILWVHPPYDYVFSDMQGYVERAARVASGQSPEHYDAFFPPGTHLILSAPFKLLGTGATGLRGAAVLWWAMSSATPLLAWGLASRLLTRRAAAITAILCALNPLFVMYGGFFSSETPGLFLLTGFLWLACLLRAASGRRAVLVGAGTGLLAGSALAVRPQFLLNAAIAFVPLLVGLRQRLRPVAALAGAAALVVLAVVLYTSSAAGEPTGLSQNGGMNFFQSHCDARQVTTGTDAPTGNHFFASPVPVLRDRGTNYAFFERRPWDEGFFYRQGLDCIADDGVGHVSRLTENVLDASATTTPWPLDSLDALKATATVTNLLVAVAWPIVILLTLLLMWRSRGQRAFRGERALLLQAACLLPIILVYDAEPRFRVLYDPFVLALAAGLIDRMLAGLGRIRHGYASAPDRC